MKKFFAFTLCLAMTFSLAACGGSAAPSAAPSAVSTAESSAGSTTEAAPESTSEPVEIIVFAAASMTETINEIIVLYKAAAPNVAIIPTFDSSGTLKTQIEEGADCDIFISAAQKQMNQLDIIKDEEANPDKLDYVLQGTRLNLLENKVALVVPEGNPAGISSFGDIANCGMIALGNSDVPVGSYSLEILEYLDLDISAMETAGRVTYGANVKEVTTQVSEGAVDCGIVYATDAFSAGLEVVDTANSEMCKQVIYPAALMNSCKNVEEAQAFLDFLRSPEAVSVFESVGFSFVG